MRKIVWNWGVTRVMTIRMGKCTGGQIRRKRVDGSSPTSAHIQYTREKKNPQELHNDRITSIK